MVGDGFVISGISGRFPQAGDLVEFKEKLYAGVDLVTDDEARWPRGLLGVPERMGTIRDLTRFDAQFFSVPPRQADVMDPQLRLLLETTYEAILDAGYDPATLRGRKVGVFVGCYVSDTFAARNSCPDTSDGYTALCSLQSMLSNRISFCFDFRGPSSSADTASSSSMTSLNHAMLALWSGQCDAAIVGGCNLLLNPCSTLNAVKLNMLSPDGRCKTFDKDANGYTRSEAVGAVFLQRESEARRVYARIVHINTSTDGYKIEGPTHPCVRGHETLLRQVYSEAKVDPREVFYVEAHGTGTKAGDPQECGAFSAVLCPPGRKTPLKIGSVKSNMGHSEGSSGITSMAKVILAMETGMIAGNLHFKEPHPNITALRDGSLEVVTETTPFPGGLIGVHSCGVGGTNVHAILESNPGPHVDTLPRQKPGLPRLVLMAGRSRDSLETSLERLASEGPHPDSSYALLNKVGQASLKQFPYRGYVVVPVDDSGGKVVKVVEQSPSERRPLWFAFTGLGCQWDAMAQQMMQFDLFASSIQRSHDLVQTLGIDLVTMITSQEASSHTMAPIFVSIVAIQVALVDTLYAMGIQPDGIVGHSLGEIGCGYADGALSAEQALLCAYWRGRCTELGNVSGGAMAVVGLTWEEAQKRCSNGVEAVCHNADDSVTVSGPAQAVAKLVEELTAEKAFARSVDTLNVAFHSSHISSVGPALREAFEKVLPQPEPRSDRWISSSVPESRWNEPIAKNCSADYFLNNFISPVLFREAMLHIPPDAIVVEIAPHCLLQPILRRSMGPASSCVGLMKRNAENRSFFLSSLGKLHTLGVQMDLSPLFPPIPWPVPRGTPSIGHLVAWDHTQTWDVVGWKDSPMCAQPSEELITIDLDTNEQDRYLADHQIDGEVLFPLSGYISLVWKCLVKRCGKPFNEVPVLFENVTLHRRTALPTNGSVQFSVSIMYTSGQFEVRQASTVAASGRVRIAVEAMSTPDKDLPNAAVETVVYELEAEDVYWELRQRGCQYGPTFKGIIKAGIQNPFGKLRWEDNWVTFIESMLQFSILRNPLRTLTTTYQLQLCHIDPQIQAQAVEKSPECGVDVIYNHQRNTLRAGGVLLRGLMTRVSKRRSKQPVQTFQEYRFVPYMDDEATRTEREADVHEYVQVCSGVTRHLLDSWCTSESHKSDIIKNLHEAPQKVIDSYLENPSENHGLLRTLVAISREKTGTDSSLDLSIKSALTANEKNIENDLLNTALFGDDALGHLLDVAVENTSDYRIRILELASQTSLFAPWIIPLLTGSNSLLRAEYTVAHESLGILGPEQTPQGVKAVTWSPSFTSSGKVPEADIIAVRGKTLTSKSLEALAEELHMLCRVNGFVLVAQRTVLSPAEVFLSAQAKVVFPVHSISEMVAAFSSSGLRLVGLKSNNMSALLLFRKFPVQAAKVEMLRVNTLTSYWVEDVQNKILEYRSKRAGENLWLLATGTSGVDGLTKCLRDAAAGGRIRCILDASIDKPNEVTDFSLSNPLYKDVVEKDLVRNVYRDGQWGSYRHAAPKSGDPPKKRTEFAMRTCSDLDNWLESPLGYSLPQSKEAGANRIFCNVYYASVNHRDVLSTTEKPPLPGCVANGEHALGEEFSGRDPEGRRVMGVVPSHAIATVVAADPLLMWEVPESWTLLEASTVPLAYSTAYYALLVRGNMRPGDAVLVHFGSCYVGQAAISIALSMGCTVFTSVGTNEECEHLQKRFPDVENWRFINFHAISQHDHILEHTEGRGVDFVLDCEDGCLPWNARYMDINAHGTNSPLLGALSLNRSSVAVTGDILDRLHCDDAAAFSDKCRVTELVSEGISSGAVRTLEATVFTADRAPEAFRVVASGRGAAKVVLQVRPEERQRNVGPLPTFTVEAISRTYFYAHKTYIVAGGMCTFGMELADWMVVRGCRKLILTTQCGGSTGYQRLCLHRWHCVGATVRVINVDISTEKGAREAMKGAVAMGPVGGIFNLLAMLRNPLLGEQTSEAFPAICEYKLNSTKRLDQLSRELCPHLDHFVDFTSTHSGRGNPGRALWCYADSSVEHICERRAADGMPGNLFCTRISQAAAD
ncbi:fatty acid synthase-like [Amblyomma americanum]